MLFLVKSNPEYSSKLLVEAKGTCALFLFLLAAKKKAFIVSFRCDTKILTADRTAGSAAICKAISSHVKISYRFYEFVTTRYTTDFYIIMAHNP